MQVNALWHLVLWCCWLVVCLPAAAEETIEVRVARQDTVSGLCARYLEQPRRWPEIAAFNHLTRPDRIYPGDALLIPVSYLKGIPLGGVVSFVDGPVERLPRGAESWQPMTLEVELAEGDRIRTGVGGEVEVTLPDAITVRIRPETELEVSAARRKGLGYTLWRLYQRTGRAIFTVRELTGKQRQMSIQTPAALAGIRGTNFRLAVDGAQTTRCEVLTGRTHLEARRQSVEVNAGQGALVAQGAAPQAPRALLEPPRMEALQAVYRRLPLELMVESQGCGQELSYQLAHDAALRRILREGKVPCGRPIRIENLADGRYYLSLAALDEVGLTGMISSPVPLEVRVHPLPPFTSQPARGQPMFSARPTFSWLRVTDAQCYRVQIARDGQFQDLVEDRGAVTETRCQSGPIDPGVYYFRICSQAAGGFQGEWSDVIDFRIVPPPAAQIAADSDSGQIQIGWQALAEASTYRFQLGRDEQFHELLLDRETAEARIAFPAPTSPGTYHVRIAALDGQGQEGDFSPGQQFTVAADSRTWLGAGIMALVFGLVILL